MTSTTNRQNERRDAIPAAVMNVSPMAERLQPPSATSGAPGRSAGGSSPPPKFFPRGGVKSFYFRRAWVPFSQNPKVIRPTNSRVSPENPKPRSNFLKVGTDETQ